MLTLAGTGEELVHASGHLLGSVDSEAQLWDVAYAHAIAELRANVGSGSGQTFEGGGFLLLVAMDGYEDACGLAAGCSHDLGDVAGSDAWVGEFSFEHGSDLLGEGVGDTVAMVGSGALLGHMVLTGANG